jgi:hypothetical protein
MPQTKTQFDADLDLVPNRWRKQLFDYYSLGVVPRSRELRAILIGDLERAIRLVDETGDLDNTFRFIRRHLPDFAHGSPHLVSRWEFMQGMLNRNTTDDSDFIGGGG